jgi:hypothetical protein
LEELRRQVLGERFEALGLPNNKRTVLCLIVIEVVSFDRALQKAKEYGPPERCVLLLGNGFSIAWDKSIFSYNALFTDTDFSLAPTAQKAFEILGTKDFEEVIRYLDIASKLATCHAEHGLQIGEKFRVDSDFIKDALVRAVAQRHPDHVFVIPDDAYASTLSFLKNFGHVFTLNYDLLLYWTLATAGWEGWSDGFRRSEFLEGRLEWRDTFRETRQYQQNVHFLHGGLHLFESNGILTKITSDGGKLVDQIKMNIREGRAPLFVCEGTSAEKMQQITRHPYLRYCLTTFSRSGSILFTFGHSLGPSDAHVMKRMFAPSFRCVFVGLHGDPGSEANTKIISAVRQWNSGNAINVEYYYTDSVELWNCEQSSSDAAHSVPDVAKRET